MSNICEACKKPIQHRQSYRSLRIDNKTYYFHEDTCYNLESTKLMAWRANLVFYKTMAITEAMADD